MSNTTSLKQSLNPLNVMGLTGIQRNGRSLEAMAQLLTILTIIATFQLFHIRYNGHGPKEKGNIKTIIQTHKFVTILLSQKMVQTPSNFSNRPLHLSIIDSVPLTNTDPEARKSSHMFKLVLVRTIQFHDCDLNLVTF